MKRLVVVGVVALTGCFDFQGTYYSRCVDAGLCGDPPDAGPTDGGSDAGLDAGRARLPCEVFPLPLHFNPDGGETAFALAATSNSFLVAWMNSNIDLLEVFSDGGTNSKVSTALTDPASLRATVTVATSGDHWVAAWGHHRAPGGFCQTDTMPAPRSFSMMTDHPTRLSVAMQPDGYVGLGAATATEGSFTPSYAAWDLGCPAVLQVSDQAHFPTSLGSAATTADGGHGFRFIEAFADQMSGGSSAVRVYEQDDGGVLLAEYPPSAVTVDQLAVAAAATGQSIVAAYYDLGSTSIMPLPYTLRVRAIPADNPAHAGASVAIADQPGDFAITSCGANCVAVSSLQGESDGVTVTFVTDNGDVAVRGTFDVNAPTSSTAGGATAIAHFGNKLGVVLVSQQAVADLYICEMPTLQH